MPALKLPKTKIVRCDWALQYPIFLSYHDEEWGVPCYDAQKLFTMLCLELLQAGLSWRIILEKRKALELHFKNFQPEKVALFTDKKIEKLLLEPSIIRNRLKIHSIIENAKCYLKLQKQGTNFADFVWQVLDGKPLINQWKTQAEVPAKTKEAEILTKALKKYGFKFLGPTIVYSFMQAVGMVNDHLVNCSYK